MKIAEICYARWQDRSLRDGKARNELDDLGFARVMSSHAEYYVPESRVGEIKCVIADLNELYKGSLWIWWWDSEEPGARGERWYPEGLTRQAD